VRRGHTDRVRRVHHYDEETPIGRESGFHVYGASAPEGIRTVSHSALAARIGSSCARFETARLSFVI